MTNVKFELLGRPFEGAGFDLVDRIVSSTLEDFDEFYAEHGMTPGAFQTYLVRLRDPRATGLQNITINDFSIPLERVTDYWESDEFIAIKENDPVGLSNPPSYTINNTDAPFEWEYNPRGKGKYNVKLKPISADDQIVADEIKRAATDLENSPWYGTDAGSFGDEIHRRVGDALRGRAGWFVDVYVDQETNEVRSIGTIPPGGTTGTTQIDLLKMKEGHRPTVGTILDKDQIDELYEIKTSATGKVDADQKRRLKKVVGGRKIKVCLSQRRWVPVHLWVDNPRVKALVRVLNVVGVASTAHAWLNSDDYDDELDAMYEQGREFKAESDPDQRRITGLVFVGMMRNYMSHFTGDTNTLNIAFGASTYAIVADAAFD